MLLTLVATGFGLAQPLVAAGLVDTVSRGGSVAGPAFVLAGLFVAQACVGAWGYFLLERTGERFLLRVRTTLCSHLVRIVLPVFDRHRIGDFISRASADVVALRDGLTNTVVQTVTSVIIAVATAVVMAFIDPVLMVMVVGVLAVSSVVLGAMSSRIGDASVSLHTTVGTLSAELERVLGAIRTVRVNRAEDREVAAMTGLAQDGYRAGVRTARLVAAIGPLSEIAMNGAFLLVLFVGASRVASGDLSLGSLVALLLYANQLVMPIGTAVDGIAEIYKIKGPARRIREVLDLPVEQPGDPQPPAPSQSAPVLEIRDVRFGYEPHTPVLRGLSLTVPQRSLVALVGASGAGKSTTFALVDRLYEPWSGTIRLNGHDTTDLGLAATRARIGWVEQDTPVLHGTLRDNLRYAVPDASDPDLWDVLDLVNLHAKIRALPSGLDTEVGERGVRLSGGERQRVAIARAILAKPDLILLDEPTAHLDPANETALTRTMADLRHECSLLVIAHRMSTIRSADRIAVLRDGVVQATGTYTDLLRTNSEFTRIVGGSATPRPPAHPATTPP